MERTKRLLVTRSNEIDSFLNLIGMADDVTSSVQTSTLSRMISEDERSILRSTALLLIYNMTEAVLRLMIDDLREHIKANRISYKGATTSIREAWISSEWANRRGIGQERATQIILDLINVSHGRAPLDINVRGVLESLSGNVSYSLIQDIAGKFGFDGMPRPALRDGYALDRVKTQRNLLAHGNISFAACGSEFPPGTLKDLRNGVIHTLDDVIANIERYVSSRGYQKRAATVSLAAIP